MFKYFPMVIIGGFIAVWSFVILLISFIRYHDQYNKAMSKKSRIITFIFLIIGIALLITGLLLDKKENDDDALETETLMARRSLEIEKLMARRS
jgi:hypothetical protein